jgi:mRNA-degrading endonuclease RelE of RelBE toxin-antitoxin system
MTEDEWLRGFLEFTRLPRKEQEEHIRRTLEKKHAEWQEPPEPGHVLRAEVRERLLQQQREVASGERGEPLENFVPIDRKSSDYTIRVLRTAANQLMSLDPEFAWSILSHIQTLLEKPRHRFEPLKGGMIGIFKRNVEDFRILYQPCPGDLLLIHDIRRFSDLFEPAPHEPTA